MELNGAELNAVELNGASAGGSVPVDPEVIVPVVSVLWAPRLMLNGVNMSHLLTGSIRIVREEGVRCLADFTLLLNAGTVNPSSYTGQSVEIYYRDRHLGSWRETLRFKGKIVRPQFSLQSRLLTCECSDQLQEVVEAMDVAAIDAVAGGLWSDDVFEDVEGRSRWDYAAERMSTQPASLQLSVEGQLQSTPWAATNAAFLIPPGTVLDGSLDYVPVELNDRTNVVEIEADYRFIRLRERHQPFAWRHPDIAGDSIDNSFCVWHTDTGDLPNKDTIYQATQDAGFEVILDGAFWLALPPNGIYCTPPVSWQNQYVDLLLGADWTGATRWAQRVTEQYRLRVEAPASVAQAGEVVGRERVAIETESDRESEFQNAEFSAPEPDATEDALGDWVVDLREENRRADGIACHLGMATTAILAAHRGNRVPFQLPTSDTLGFRLEHTLHVQDVILGTPVQCRAKVFSITDEWDLDSGAALTSIVLAVSQGGGDVADPLVPPAAPASTPPGDTPALIILPSQFSGHLDSPAYDEELLGFSGNYANYNSSQDRFEVRLDLDAPEIPAEHRDEYAVTQQTTYRVPVPDDLVEF
ncbi:hypothetical protein M2318_004841 [Metapseudomonas resinovorans]|uniref:hypothetical protein n=1 Tax=Metapseudomonas resinovorans TaxID=53412 RepID=UPI003D1F002E